MRAAGRDRVRRRPVRLLEVGRVGRARPLGEQRVEAVQLDAVVLGEQPVDVHAAAADRERAAGGGERNASGVWRGTHATPAWSGSGPNEVRSHVSARRRRSSSATYSLKSASSSSLPCWSTTPAKSRSGSNLTRLMSAPMPLSLPVVTWRRRTRPRGRIGGTRPAARGGSSRAAAGTARASTPISLSSLAPVRIAACVDRRSCM